MLSRFGASVKGSSSSDRNNRTHRTTTKWRTREPDFHEQFVYSVPSRSMDDLKKLNLHISVWDKENGRPDEYIGTFSCSKIYSLELQSYHILFIICVYSLTLSKMLFFRWYYCWNISKRCSFTALDWHDKTSRTNNYSNSLFKRCVCWLNLYFFIFRTINFLLLAYQNF